MEKLISRVSLSAEDRNFVLAGHNGLFFPICVSIECLLFLLNDTLWDIKIIQVLKFCCNVTGSFSWDLFL